MRVKLNMTPEQVMEKLPWRNVTRARNLIDDVEWSAEDATRSEMDYLCRIIEAVIKAGATTVNFPTPSVTPRRRNTPALSAP